MIPANQAIVVVLAIVPIPWLAAGYPSIGHFIGNSPFSIRCLLFSILFPVVGFAAFLTGVLSLKPAIYSICPIYHWFLIKFAYWIWFKFNNRKPKNVTFNFKSGLFGDRLLAISIALGGVIPPMLIIGR